MLRLRRVWWILCREVLDCRQRATRSSRVAGGLVVITVAAVGCLLAAAPLLASRIDLPRPDLTALEATVRQEIESERKALDEAVASLSGQEAARLGARYGRLGQTYHVYALDDAASACYANALALSPEVPRWAYLAGVLAEKRGDFGAAG